MRDLASDLRKAGAAMAQTGEDTIASWGKLSTCYTAPESDVLYSALDPISADGEEVETGTDRAANALDDFADELQKIKREWHSLRGRSETFRESVVDDPEWDKPDHLLTRQSSNVDKSNELRDDAERLISWYERVQRECANTINEGLYGRTRFFSSQQVQDNDLGFNVFVYDTVHAHTDIPSMWGEDASADQFWYQDAWDATWDFGVGAAEGVGAMVGAHSSKGWLEMSWGDAFKEYHWDNITAAASLAGMYDAESDSLKWSGPETIHEAWGDLLHSIVPWEEWGERPGYVIGTAVLNIGVAAVGIALTATGVGAAVGVPLLAWRGMAILDGMGGSGRGGSGVDLPNLPDLPGHGGQGAPVVHLTRQDLEASGLNREQIAEIEAALERALTEQGIDPHTGTGPSGPGRGPQDPTVADTLLFDDIINHPDNAAFGDQARSTNQRDIDAADREAKTNPSRTPSSEEGAWTGDAGEGRGPDSSGDREPAMAGGGRPSETMDAGAARSTPEPSSTHARSDGIDAPGNDRSSGNEIADNRGDRGADMSDRNPTATNQDGNGPNPNDENTRNDGPSNEKRSNHNLTNKSTQNDSIPLPNIDPNKDNPALVQNRRGDYIEYGSVDSSGRWIDPNGLPHLDTPVSIKDAIIYDRIRNTEGDTSTISDRTGINEEVLDRIKEHIFLKDHDAAVGPNSVIHGRFGPMPHIASWWEKSQFGKIPKMEEKFFRKWLEHEAVESKLMEWGMPYRSMPLI